MNHIHFTGIGGIGMSGLARHYASLGYRVTGSDTVRSVITDRLIAQGIPVYIGESADQITRDTSLVVYTEGIVRNDEDHEDALRRNPETNAGLEKNIPVLSYPQALGEVFNDRYGVAIAGTHGKSTTTSLLGLVVQASHLPASTLTGTNLSQFEGTNYYTSGDQYFVIEACEHKRHFLNYHPQITIITNIEADHLDYYRDEDDYEQAFAQFMRQTSGAIILTGGDPGSERLRDDRLPQIWVYDDYFEVPHPGIMNLAPGIHNLPKITLQVPGEHILQDARLAYVAAHLLKLPDELILPALYSYSGAWRRMEMIGQTPGGNMLMSDYGHHPTEIEVTLRALKSYYHDKHLFVIFQPHQYSRTIELLGGFMTCFDDADTLLIPDIYFSRDSQQDVATMPVSRFVGHLRERYPDVIDGEGLEHSAKLILEHDQTHQDVLYLLLGAGDVDNLRQNIISL